MFWLATKEGSKTAGLSVFWQATSCARLSTSGTERSRQPGKIQAPEGAGWGRQLRFAAREPAQRFAALRAVLCI